MSCAPCPYYFLEVSLYECPWSFGIFAHRLAFYARSPPADQHLTSAEEVGGVAPNKEVSRT